MNPMGTAALQNDLFSDPKGPIERFWWGNFVIAGELHGHTDKGRVGAGKDIRIVRGRVTPWKDRKGHRLKRSMITGVYVGDVGDVGDVDVLIIGNGLDGAVEVPDKVRRAIAEHGIPELIVERTPEACRVYNKLSRKGRRVALLAHGTG